MSTERDNENFEYCKRIALELEAIVNGDFVRHPDYNDAIEVKEDERGRYAEIDGEVYREDPEDEENDLDELDAYTIYDYMEDVLDFEYTITSRREYRAVSVAITLGGPNVYLNTKTGDVELYWWSEQARYPMEPEVIEAIDNYFEELFAMC